MPPAPDENASLTIGVWNLDSSQPSSRRAAQGERLRNAAHVWLLTEVHADAVHGLPCRRGGSMAGMKKLSWSGVATRRPISDRPESGHPTLALARVAVTGGAPVLFASSVFPWRSAGRHWPDADPDAYRERFLAVLASHRRLIEAEAQAGEAVVWGGDFNQELREPHRVGFAEGRDAVLEAFGAMGLKAVTTGAGGLPDGAPAIDHLAVPRSWECGPVVETLPDSEGRPLSDHRSYTATVVPARA